MLHVMRRLAVSRGMAMSAVLLLAVALPATAQADGGDGTGLDPVTTAVIDQPAGLDQFTFLVDGGDPSGGGTGASDDAWSLVESPYSLDDVDALTGQLLAPDVRGALSSELSTETDLLATDQLAINAAQLAEQARLEEIAKEKAAQAAAAQHGVALGRTADPGAPQPWEMKHFTGCGSAGNAHYEDRIALVDAFEQMCQAASAAGVRLVIDSAYRDPALQRQLFAQAVAKYGSAAAAAKWVAEPTSDGSCTSRHCSGAAIDVSQSGSAGPWMHATVGCDQPGGTPQLGASSCPAGQAPVERVQLYGFVFPMAYEPWHIELGIPIDAAGSTAASCTPPASDDVPEMIASIFRCGLGKAGITGDSQRLIVAQALVVSKCESQWNPRAVAFGGRYVSTPDPATGKRYTAAGVFQFLDTTANEYISGGYANVFDPVANINGAVTYYLAERKITSSPWDPWACAGANDGFQKDSVLPGYPRGPASLPSWAYNY